MAILESVRELASKLGADTNGRTIADQINIINQHLEGECGNDIAGAVKEYSKKAGSSGGAHFAKMSGNFSIGGTLKPITFICNDSTVVDVSEISSLNIVVINPVDELKVKPLTTIGVSYNISFVPTENCKVYEGDTEIDLSSIFQPETLPSGQTSYNPNGIKPHFIQGTKSPYEGVVRKLKEHRLSSTDFYIE